MPERLGGLEVYHELEFCRLLDRQVSRLGTLWDAGDIIGSPPIHGFSIDSIRHQPARLNVGLEYEHGRQTMHGSKFGNFITVRSDSSLRMKIQTQCFRGAPSKFVSHQRAPENA